MMYFYYEPEEAKKHFDAALDVSGLKVELTGVFVFFVKDIFVSL